MNTQTFLIALNNSLGAYFVTIELRPVRFQRRNGVSVNVENEKLVNISTDILYNPLQDRIEEKTGDRFAKMHVDEAVELLKEFSAFPVKDGFDRYNADDLNGIKEHLSKEWKEMFNAKTGINIG